MSALEVEPDVTEPTTEPAPEEEPTTEPEPETETETRCEAETTVGGTLYRCALTVLHDGEHSFSPAQDQPPAKGEDDKAKRAAVDKLVNEAERHHKRVAEIMGDDAQYLIKCELCMPQFAGWRFDGSPDDETITRVRVAIGLPDLSNFAPSATERQCDDCRGLGRVRTGSSVAKHETALCDACAGRGYIASRPRLNTDETPAAPTAPGLAVVPNDDDGVRRDMFGTPETDPDFGLMPNMRARPTDYWQTHRE